METSDLHAVPSTTVRTQEPTEGQAGSALDPPRPSDTTAAMASYRGVEVLEHAWEPEKQRFTADDCSVMSVRRLRQLCDETFRALDSDLPAWGTRDEYEMLSLELTARAKTAQNVPASRHRQGALRD